MKTKVTYQCPLCNGCGSREISVDINFNEKEAIVKAMRAQGATLEEIAKAIKVKSLSTVDYYLKKKGNDTP